MEEILSAEIHSNPDNAILGGDGREARIRHQFFLLIIGAIVAAIILVLIALSLYTSSGAEQLDLSRPGISSAVREQASNASNKEDAFNGFSSSGPINQKVLSEFNALYQRELDQANGINAFGNDVLSDQSLQIQPKAAP